MDLENGSADGFLEGFAGEAAEACVEQEMLVHREVLPQGIALRAVANRAAGTREAGLRENVLVRDSSEWWRNILRMKVHSLMKAPGGGSPTPEEQRKMPSASCSLFTRPLPSPPLHALFSSPSSPPASSCVVLL